MSEGIWTALSGAMAQLSTLEVAANNMANAATPGYRADRVVFREELARAQARGRSTEEKKLRYTVSDAVAVSNNPGALKVTGRGLDVALKNEGLLAIKTPGGERYTRAGSLQVSPAGVLVTRDGGIVLDEARNPIHVPTDGSEISVGRDGMVTANKRALGRLLEVRFEDPRTLIREGALMFRAGEGTAPQAVPAEIEPGCLEESNVSTVQGMVELISATRAFETCQRAIEAFRDADRRATMTVMGNG